MELYASHDYPKGYGGGPASFISDFLGGKPVEFGTALDTIEVRICNDGIEVPALWSGFSMPDQPSCRFLRKRRKLIVTWPGSRHTAGEVHRLSLRKLNHDLFQRGAAEVYDVLAWAFAQRLKPTDDFDATSCLAWVATAQNASFTSDQALQEQVNRRGRRRRTRLRKANLDKALNIDWTVYHPEAAYSLPDPWLWSETEERAPHGNLVGAAILSNWALYSQLDAEAALNFSGLPAWSAGASVAERQNAVRLHLALAIAHLKFTSKCPADIARATIACLRSEKAAPNSPWARHYKGIPVSALDQFLHILEP